MAATGCAAAWGAGGFGTVWLAWDDRLEREVALKLLPRERIASGRFDREARAAARLNHPGIVILYEAAVDDEGGYLVSELVRGHTLDRLLDEGRLSDRDVVRAAICLCDALDYAHGQGVVHRDVKPSNILMPDAPASAAGVAKLTDFGVARLVGGDSLTRTGDVVGTTAYMAPEQAEGREADASADLYSLALVLYEALTGVNPVRLTGPPARGGRRLGTYLPAIRRHRRDLPRELACAVDLALRPRARERGTVQELRQALVPALHRVDDEPDVVAAPGWPGSAVSPGAQAPAAWPAPAARPAQDTQVSPLPLPRLSTFEGLADPPPRATWSVVARLLTAAAAAAATAWFATGVLSPSPVLPALAVLITGLAVAVAPACGLAGPGHGRSWPAHRAGRRGWGDRARGGGSVEHPAPAPPSDPLGTSGQRPGPGSDRPGWTLACAGRPGLCGLGAPDPGCRGVAMARRGRFSGRPQRISGVAGGDPAPRDVDALAYDTVHRVLDPLLFSGLMAPALIWGVGAVILPWITSRLPRAQGPGSWLIRWALLLVWAGALVLLTNGVLVALDPAVRISPGGAVLGALACAFVAGLPWPGALQRPAGLALTRGRDSRSMETR